MYYFDDDDDEDDETPQLDVKDGVINSFKKYAIIFPN